MKKKNSLDHAYHHLDILIS